MDKSLSNELYWSRYEQARNSCWNVIGEDPIWDARCGLWNPIVDAVWDRIRNFVYEEMKERTC